MAKRKFYIKPQEAEASPAKQNIPNINVPKLFFMPTLKYLKERYNIEFKDKPQWEF